MVGGAIALGLGAYGIKKLRDLNKRINTAHANYYNKLGKKPSESTSRTIINQTISAFDRDQRKPFIQMFQPEITSKRNKSGKFTNTVVQPRGTVRASVKNRIDRVLGNKPFAHAIVTDIGRNVANRIYNKFK